MYNRLISMDKIPKESFFLWGPRQSGKSTLLKSLYPEAHRIDLLHSENFLKYQAEPSLFRKEISLIPPQKLIIVDEIQSLPILLNEVHALIESERRVFGLCGSSARKLKRHQANMLGGRAIRYELRGLCKQELGDDFDLSKILNFGYLPSHYLTNRPERRLRSYIGDYLKFEIAAEGVTRNLPAFSDFLRSAALGDTDLISFASIATDCGVSADTVRNYFQVLEDTLIAKFVPVFSKRQKRKIATTPKVYFFDVGIVNELAKRGKILAGSELFGKAFENWVFHELSCHRDYSELFYDIHFWRLQNKIEVDFILGDMEVAIEVKGTSRIRPEHFTGLRSIHEEHPNLKKRILVTCVDKSYRSDDGIFVLNYADFIERLWSGEIIK